MSTFPRDELELQAAAQHASDQTEDNEAVLVELGKVSETEGSFFGAKMDIGNGFQYY